MTHETRPRTVKINGRRYTYLTLGEQQPLIFIPGWCDQSDDYLGLIKELSKNFKVYVPDLPNFGKSRTKEKFCFDTYSKFLTGFIETLKIKNPTIVGFSFGGIIAVDLAYKTDLKSVFLINSLGAPDMKPKLFLFISILANTILEIGSSPVHMTKILYHWFRNFLSNVWRRDFRSFQNQILYTGHPSISKVDEKITVIWSINDVIFKPEYPFILKNSFQNARLIRLPGGHFDCTLNPKKYAKIITKNGSEN
ncbi:alpha/beta fold hydrolase [Candidatus Dojkabacteria bacterium]|nr:alpha/beta fold hydrolase [Candidatus Dojkabacteria bacterium]